MHYLYIELQCTSELFNSFKLCKRNEDYWGFQLNPADAFNQCNSNVHAIIAAVRAPDLDYF